MTWRALGCCAALVACQGADDFEIADVSASVTTTSEGDLLSGTFVMTVWGDRDEMLDPAMMSLVIDGTPVPGAEFALTKDPQKPSRINGRFTTIDALPNAIAERCMPPSMEVYAGLEAAPVNLTFTGAPRDTTAFAPSWSRIPAPQPEAVALTDTGVTVLAVSSGDNSAEVSFVDAQGDTLATISFSGSGGGLIGAPTPKLAAKGDVVVLAVGLEGDVSVGAERFPGDASRATVVARIEQGGVVWATRIPDATPHDISVGAGGDVGLVGTTPNGEFIASYDASGTQRYFTHTDATSTVAVLPNGDLITTGGARSIARLDGTGAPLWSQDSLGEALVTDMEIDGDIVLVADAPPRDFGDGPTGGGNDLRTTVVKLSAAGELVWARGMGSRTNKPRMALGPNGHVFLSFDVARTVWHEHHYTFVAELDASGEPLRGAAVACMATIFFAGSSSLPPVVAGGFIRELAFGGGITDAGLDWRGFVLQLAP